MLAEDTNSSLNTNRTLRAPLVFGVEIVYLMIMGVKWVMGVYVKGRNGVWILGVGVCHVVVYMR